MSEVTPAEWRKHFFACGMAVWGLTALIWPLLLKADAVFAEQNTAMADANTAAIPGGSTAAKLPAVYSVRLIKQAADKLKLKGLVATKDDHKVLLGLVKASFPSADVSDRIKIVDGPKRDMKLGGISFALKALSYLQAGSARIDDQGIALSGDTESRAVYAEVTKLIHSGCPTGLTVKNDITQPSQSFSLRAEVGQGKVKLTGAVSDGSDKKALDAVVKKLFSGLEIVNDTYVAEGAPDSWLDAAMHSLKVLRLLNSGVVQLADHSIRLDGHASDEATMRRIDALAGKYPAGFAVESSVSAPPAQASMFSLGLPYSAAAAAAGFQATEGISRTNAGIDLMTGAGGSAP
jgi:hypothetical protein